jgi:hypothetical protein
MARPTDYNEAILELSKSYLKNLPKEEKVHSIEGLADYLDISRTTIYDWISQEDKAEFSYIVGQILNKQGKTLINKGLIGEFNQSITKVMLTKHGYREGIEQTGKDGEKLTVQLINYEDSNNSSQP